MKRFIISDKEDSKKDLFEILDNIVSKHKDIPYYDIKADPDKKIDVFKSPRKIEEALKVKDPIKDYIPLSTSAGNTDQLRIAVHTHRISENENERRNIDSKLTHIFDTPYIYTDGLENGEEDEIIKAKDEYMHQITRSLLKMLDFADILDEYLQKHIPEKRKVTGNDFYDSAALSWIEFYSIATKEIISVNLASIKYGGNNYLCRTYVSGMSPDTELVKLINEDKIGYSIDERLKQEGLGKEAIKKCHKDSKTYKDIMDKTFKRSVDLMLDYTEKCEIFTVTNDLEVINNLHDIIFNRGGTSLKLCKHCGRVFITMHRNTLYCCDTCKKLSKKERQIKKENS